jgi:prepilin-type N-terminal cleavage/methylation domain-containing protein
MLRIINKLKNKKGFTLIELIVVLAVLAIIMAIAVPRFIGVRETASVDSDIATITSIAKLAELEYVRQNKNTTGDAETVLGTGVLKELIEDNFVEGALFQSKNLKTLDAKDVAVNFAAKGKVDKVTVGTYVFNNTNGVYTAPSSILK